MKPNESCFFVPAMTWNSLDEPIDPKNGLVGSTKRQSIFVSKIVPHTDGCVPIYIYMLNINIHIYIYVCVSQAPVC